MDLLITIIYIFAISIVVLAFIDLKLSVAVYISYLILVPYLQFRIAGFPLSYNLVNSVILAVFLYHSLIKKKYKLNFQVINPFLFLYFSLLALSLFTWGMPWNIQFNYWRSSIMQTCIISFIIWNIATSEPKSLNYFKWSLIISILISGIYGIILMRLNGINPYASLVTNYFGILDSATKFSNASSRLDFSSAGKIQSTMNHPMNWAIVLCFSLITFIALFLKSRNKFYFILLVLIGFNILISGVRTGIASLILGFGYFIYKNKNFKLWAFSILLILASVMVIQSNDNLSNLFSSFTDISGQKSDVKGSSITMRISQFEGVKDELNGHLFPGRGFSWSSYYLSLHGGHRKLLAFESIIYTVLCNSGIIGAFLWITFFILIYLQNRKLFLKKIDVIFLDALTIVFLAYAIGTGEYSFLSFFAIFYSFLCAFLNNTNKLQPNQTS